MPGAPNPFFIARHFASKSEPKIKGSNQPRNAHTTAESYILQSDSRSLRSLYGRNSKQGMEVDHREDVEVDAPIKRRRISIPRNDGQPYLSLFAGAHQRRESNSQKSSAVIDNCDDEKSNISFSATPKQAGQTVAPFLAKHIPAQYLPAGQVEPSSTDRRTDSNTKYCYRHRPDLKCRRQANEPSMEQLQNVWTLVPHP